MSTPNAFGNAGATMLATTPVAFTSVEILHWVWIALGAAAGALTALSLPAYQALSRQGKLFTASIGFAFALFLGPVIAPAIYKLFSSVDPASTGGMGACYYLIGLVGNSVVPVIFKSISARIESTLGGMVKTEVVEATAAANRNPGGDAAPDGTENA